MTAPIQFTRAQLGWEAWLQPVPAADLNARQRDALVDPARVKSEYFRLLAHDPDILGARTRTDKDIFYNVAEGAPRADRELAAATVSRLNGCIYCASVHARFAATYSKRDTDIDRLLADGPTTDLGDRWNAIAAATVALTTTPPTFGPTEITNLRNAGLDDLEIADVILAASFFNWANRLMLSLGEPTLPSP